MASSNKNTSKPLVKSDNISFRFEGSTIFISGKLSVDNSGTLTRSVLRKVRAHNLPEIVINLEELEDIDSAGVMTLNFIKKKISKKSTRIRIEGAGVQVSKKIQLFSSDFPAESDPSLEQGFIEVVGKNTYEFIFSYLYNFLLLAANIFYWAVADLFRTKTTREGEFVNQSVHIGVNASFIIIIMSFAVGFVMAIQSAGYLRNFGADIYIVDLIVISIMSQMGPLLTAVLVAGRSGSSIAAEVATMKITSELDALKTMGLDPVRYVVVPKLYAGLFTIPLLIILANVSGIAGGAAASYYSLDITPEIFINRMVSVMNNKDLLTAFIKSQVYACIIVLTGSFFGFRAEMGAEGVGKVTTQAVVASISIVILADSFMAVLFY